MKGDDEFSQRFVLKLGVIEKLLRDFCDKRQELELVQLLVGGHDGVKALDGLNMLRVAITTLFLSNKMTRH